MEGLSHEFLKHLKDNQMKISVTTTFGSSEMDDIILYGTVDFVNSNYITLKDAYINNKIPVKGTYFSFKDIPGEAIVVIEHIYSIFVLGRE